MKPLEPWLQMIDGVQNAESLFTVTGELQRVGANPLLRIGVDADFKNPRLEIAQFSQGGLGLPDRSYYVSDDAKKKEILAKYQDYVATMLGLLGESDADAATHAGQIVQFETELAKVSRERADLRDPDKTYHRLDADGLQKLTPDLPWPSMFAALGSAQMKEINVETPEFFEGLQKTLASTDSSVLREYLRWQAVNNAAPALSKPFVDAHFAFYGKTLQGQEEMRPRWKRCVNFTNHALGEALGKLYVEKRFAGSSKAKAQEMIRDIENAFESNLPSLDWMDDTTRARAKEKVAALANKIGYPDKWRDYATLGVRRGDFFANVVSGAEFETARQLRKVGNPVDRSEWFMTPQMVNAYNNPLQNEIVFPAGILQPPFFSKDFPAALNYGGIGAVVGHELTHGFDDQGRKFDAEGRLREWWEPAVAKKFEQRAQCVRDQYSAYEIQPGVHLNGKLTAGENIADIGGLKEAHSAYESWEARHDPGQATPKLTNEQLFYVAFGQVWCTLATPEVERVRVSVDPHSPPKFRVIGAISDNPDFAAAFDCKAGDPMVPKNQCVVW
jgi:putative endopeptidase